MTEPFKLQSYTLADSPEYPTGRRKGEELSAFIRRKQTQELRSACKDIFAPVSLYYEPPIGERRTKMLRAALQKRYPPDCPRAHAMRKQAEYAAVMEAKRGRVA